MKIFKLIQFHRAAVGDLILRVMTGFSMALVHGLAKMPPAPTFIESVAGMGFPLPAVFAWSAGLAEFAGGLLLALGLATRPAAASIAFTMGVAFFGRHAEDAFKQKELSYLYLAICTYYLLRGSGRFSLDQVLFHRKS